MKTDALARANRRATRQYGNIARQQALQCGLSDDDVYRLHKNGLWLPVHVGVSRIAGSDESWESKLMAATLAGGRVYAARRAAAQLWGFHGFFGDVIEVVLPHNLEYAPTNVIAHRTRCLPPVDLTTRLRIPSTSPVRTLCDLAACTPAEKLIDVVDDGINRGLFTPRRINRRLDELARPGRRGMKMLREIMREYSLGEAVPTKTFERRLLRLLRAAGLPPCTIHYIVTIRGVEIELDFAWPEHKVAVEANSRKFHDLRSRVEVDEWRRGLLGSDGWLLIPVRWSLLCNRPDIVVQLVRDALRGRS